MKIKLLVCLLLGVFICQLSQAQVIHENTGYGESYPRLRGKLVMQMPTFCGVPTFNIAKKIDSGYAAIGFDSCNHRLYFYDPKTAVWDTIKGGGGSGGVTLPQLVDSLGNYVTALFQVDDTLLYYVQGGTAHLFATIRAGGGGATNSNIGSGYRLAVPGTNNIKTLFFNAPLIGDSSSNTNAITVLADTSKAVGKLATYSDVIKKTDSVSNNAGGDSLIVVKNNVRSAYAYPSGGGGSYINNQYAAKQTSPSRFWIDSGRVDSSFRIGNNAYFKSTPTFTAFPKRNATWSNKAINLYMNDSTDFNLIWPVFYGQRPGSLNIIGGGGLSMVADTSKIGPIFGSGVGGLSYRGKTENFSTDSWLMRGGLIVEDTSANWLFSAIPGYGFNVGGAAGLPGVYPLSSFEVHGNASIGLSYDRLRAAPTNGLRVEGSVAIGTTASVTNGLTVASNAAIGTTSNLTNGLTVIGPVAIGTATNISNAMTLNYTMPSSIAAFTKAVDFQVTSAGSSSQVNAAFNVDYNAGYTGNSRTVSGRFTNVTAGTGAGDILTTNTYNIGLQTSTTGTTTGKNIGIISSAFNGSENIGILGTSLVAKNSAINIGGAFFAANTGTSPTYTALYAGLNTTEPTFTNSAFTADNGAIAAPIAIFRDNGTKVFSIEDGGNPTLALGNKLVIATGTNASIGTATLVAGTVTVSTTAALTASKIFVTVTTPGGTQGFLSVPTITNATSFVITSTSATETSIVNWWIIN